MQNVLDKIQGMRVLVLGDLMLDHFVWGDASRISPEAPVPVVNVSKDTYVPGGAANVALNVKSLGGRVELFGTLRNDDAGAELMKLLHAKDVKLDSRLACIEAPTIVKTRVVVRNQQLCRIDREESPSEYELKDDDLYDMLARRVEEVDLVIFSDYAKGVVSTELIEYVQRVARDSNTFVALDPKPRHQISYSGLDLLTPNRSESLQMAGITLSHHDKFPAEAVCQGLWDKYQCKHTVITLGADGMLLSHEGQIIKHLPTVAQEVYDVSGAGDTVIASLSMALAKENSFEASGLLANNSAGVVVSKLGTATVSPEEVVRHAEQYPIRTPGVALT